MSKKKQEAIYYKPVDSLPSRKFGERVKEYNDVIQALLKENKGIYLIEIPNRKAMSVYVALQKRIKKYPTLKLHMRSKQVYIEKLS